MGGELWGGSPNEAGSSLSPCRNPDICSRMRFVLCFRSIEKGEHTLPFETSVLYFIVLTPFYRLASPNARDKLLKTR